MLSDSANWCGADELRDIWGLWLSGTPNDLRDIIGWGLPNFYV
jgi:hypothetical protein